MLPYTLAFCAVLLKFNAFAMSLVITPVPNVLETVRVQLRPVTMVLTLEPLALIRSAISINQFSLALVATVVPVAVVLVTARVYLMAVPVFLSRQKEALVAVATWIGLLAITVLEVVQIISLELGQLGGNFLPASIPLPVLPVPEVERAVGPR